MQSRKKTQSRKNYVHHPEICLSSKSPAFCYIQALITNDRYISRGKQTVSPLGLISLYVRNFKNACLRIPSKQKSWWWPKQSRTPGEHRIAKRTFQITKTTTLVSYILSLKKKYNFSCGFSIVHGIDNLQLGECYVSRRKIPRRNCCGMVILCLLIRNLLCRSNARSHTDAY